MRHLRIAAPNVRRTRGDRDFFSRVKNYASLHKYSIAVLVAKFFLIEIFAGHLV